jgi:hypothetical protein
MREGSQLYICMVETLIICLCMTILQIVELTRVRSFLGDIYNPIPGDSNPSI